MSKWLKRLGLGLCVTLGMALGSVLGPDAEAQRGYTIRAPKYATVNLPTCSSAVNAGTLVWDTTSVSFKVCDGSAFVESGTFGGIGGSGTADRISKFSAATTLEDSSLLNVGIPAAGASGQIIVFNTTLNAMDSSDDEVCVFCTTFTNGAHTDGELNTYFAGDITATAAQESAFYVEAIAPTSYDFALRQGGGAPTMFIAGDAAVDITAEGGQLILVSDTASVSIQGSGSGQQSSWEQQGSSGSFIQFTLTGINSLTGTTFHTLLNAGLANTVTLNGDDTVRHWRVTPNLSLSSTGTGNFYYGYAAASIGVATAVTKSAFAVDSAGWDYFLTADVRTAAATENPDTNDVGLFFDESTDRGAGGGTADCALVARLNNGTEVTITVLVTDGGCP